MQLLSVKRWRTRSEDPWAKPISPVSEAQLRRALGNKPEACILTEDDGSYVQIGRSGFCCCVEWCDQNSRKHKRAYQEKPVVPWPGVTSIVFLNGELMLRQEEYFSPEQALEVLLGFLKRRVFPDYVQWRDLTSELESAGFNPFHEKGRNDKSQKPEHRA